MRELALWLLMLGFGLALLMTPFLAAGRRSAGRHERRDDDWETPAPWAVRDETGRPLAAGTMYGAPPDVEPEDLAAVDVAVPATRAVGRATCATRSDRYRGRHGALDVDAPVAPVPDPDPTARVTAAGVNLWFAARIAETCGPGAR